MLNFNRLPDDRTVDRCPAQNRSTILDMLDGDVPGRVQIGVQLEPARTTAEDRLGNPTALVSYSTSRAGLRRMTRVDRHHPATCRIGLVCHERTQLGEGPGVQPPTLTAATLPNPGPYVGQVLKHKSGAWSDRLHDPLAEHMVAIPPKPCRLPAQTTQTPFGLDGAFGLELTTQPERALLDGPPMPRAVKHVVRCDRRSIKPEVDADDLARVSERNVGQCDDRVKPQLGLAKDQVCTIETDRLTEQFCSVRVNSERDDMTTTDRCETGCAIDHPIRVLIVSDRNHCPGWARHGASSLPERQCRGDRFGCPHPGRYDQLRWKRRVFASQAVVGRLVQFDAVSLLVFPAICRHGVEARAALLHRSQQACALLWSGLESQADRSLHRHILRYFQHHTENMFYWRCF